MGVRRSVQKLGKERRKNEWVSGWERSQWMQSFVKAKIKRAKAFRNKKLTQEQHTKKIYINLRRKQECEAGHKKVKFEEKTQRK